MRKILLVEDDQRYRESLKLLLGHSSYIYYEAATPTEGLEVIKHDPEIRVILLDLSFKTHPSGTRLLDGIKQRATDYRVIVLTAHEELLRAEKAGEYEVFHYLPKAQRSTREALRFSVAQAFNDLDHESLERKHAVILDIQRRINEGKPLTEVLDLICDAIRNTVSAYTCHIRVYDFARGDYDLVGFAGPEKLRSLFERPKPRGALFSGVVVDTGRKEIISDLQQDPRFQRFLSDSETAGDRSEEVRRYWSDIGSAYLVPLFTGLIGDEVDAVINLSSTSVAYFGDSSTQLVSDFVTLATIAVTKDWLHKKRSEAHRDYGLISNLLDKMSDALGKLGALVRICEIVARGISDLLRPEVISIFLYNDLTDRVENVAELRGETFRTDFVEGYSRGESLTGKVFETGSFIQLPEKAGQRAIEHIDFGHDREADLNGIPSSTIDHYLGVPIRIDGTVRGVLRVMNKKSSDYGTIKPGKPRFCLLPRGFSVDCRNVLEITASHLSVAIRNAGLVEKLRSLGVVGRLISSARDINEVLTLTMAKMAGVMHARIWMLFLREDDEARITLRESVGMPGIPEAYYDFGEGATGAVAQTGRAQLLSTAEDHDGKYDRTINEYLAKYDGAAARIESLMIAPIKAKGIVVGVIKVINKKGGGSFSEGDLELFETFTDYVGVAVENAQIYELTNNRLAVAERNSALSSLVRAVAHEVNNTIGLIPANIENIRAHMGTPVPAVDRALARIERVAAQAGEFANDIAGFSETLTGEQQALELNHIVREWIDTFKEDQKYKGALAKGIALVPSLTPDTLCCEIYRTPFEQVIRNVVINAIEALEGTERGEVKLTLDVGMGEFEGNAVIDVQDNGPGIKPEHRAKIFEPDFTTKSKGNGVGLWLVRNHLEQIHGKIDFITEVGVGTTFRITLPLKNTGRR